MPRRVELGQLKLPAFGLPSVQPVIPPATYKARIDVVLTCAVDAGYDALLVYGDREHFANLAYLTGYDPRFEEALLILLPGRKPTLLLGNEGMAYSGVSSIALQRILYQTFSLLGQPRGNSPMLRDVFISAGLRAGQRLGIAGWKSFDAREASDPARALEIPAFIVDALADIVGDRDRLFNASDIFMHPATGLRASNDVDQLACFEFAASYTSQAVRNLIFGVEADMSEFEAVALMQMTGLPQSCHLMFSSGERAGLGLASPSLRRMQRRRSRLSGLRHLGRAQCSRRLAGSRRNRLAGRCAATMLTCSSRPTSAPSLSGTKRLASVSPAANCIASSSRIWAIHSSASGLTRVI